MVAGSDSFNEEIDLILKVAHVVNSIKLTVDRDSLKIYHSFRVLSIVLFTLFC